MILLKVVTKYSDDSSVHCFNLRNQSWLWKRLQPRISKYIKNNLITNNYSAHNIAFPNTGALKELNKKENNSTKKIIHMHWLGDNTISIEEIAKLKSPIFWTLHDQWAFCGLNTILTRQSIKMVIFMMNVVRIIQNQVGFR